MSADPLDEAAALHERSVELLAEDRSAEAEAFARRALELLRTHGDPAGADGPDTVNVLVNLAAVRRRAGDLAEAESLGRKAVTLSEPWPFDGDVLDRLRVQALQSLGTTLVSAGQYKQAGAVLRSALALAEEQLGTDDPEVGVCCNGLGVIGKYTGRFDEAEAYYPRALAIAESGGLPDDAQASIWHNVGGVRHAAGRAEEAEGPARRAYEMRTALHGRSSSRHAGRRRGAGRRVDRLGPLRRGRGAAHPGARITRSASSAATTRWRCACTAWAPWPTGEVTWPGRRSSSSRRSTSKRRCWASIIPSWR